MSVISHFLSNKFTKCSCADTIHPAQGILFTHAADLEEQVPVIILVFPSFAVEDTIIGASSVCLTAAVHLFITRGRNQAAVGLHFLTLATYCLLLFFSVWLPKLRGTCGAVSSTSHWLTVWNNWQMVRFSFHFSQAGAVHAHGSVGLTLGQKKTEGLSKRPRDQTERTLWFYNQENRVMIHRRSWLERAVSKRTRVHENIQTCRWFVLSPSLSCVFIACCRRSAAAPKQCPEISKRLFRERDGKMMRGLCSHKRHRQIIPPGPRSPRRVNRSGRTSWTFQSELRDDRRGIFCGH